MITNLPPTPEELARIQDNQSKNRLTDSNDLETLKKELQNFNKQKDDLFADYMRLEGIIAYISAKISKLTSVKPEENKS